MTTPNHSRPHASIVVAEAEERIRNKRGRWVCRDQIDIRYKHRIIPAFFFRSPTDRQIDLMRVLAAIAHADRRIPRRPSICWGRDIEIEAPVSDPDYWSSVREKLTRVLGVLTGDVWSFSFRKLQDRIQFPVQHELEFPAQGQAAMAYSNGLDSFASARLVASGVVPLHGRPGRKHDLVLITTGKAFNAQLKQEITNFGYSTRQVSVPFSIRRIGEGFELREQSYRTRALTFQTMAALAASQSQGDVVIVPESGQGSIGPWLTVTGQEAADVRTHPIFTAILSDWLETVLERRIRFEHPHIWETKGQTLSRLVSNNLHTGWTETFSCAVQARHQWTKGRRVQCGLCPNCLLRRQSLLAAGLHESNANYDGDHLLAESADTRRPGLRKRIAQGLLPLIEFAQIGATPITARTTDRLIGHFSRLVNENTSQQYTHNVRVKSDEMKRLTIELAETHKRELVTFLSQCLETSLLRQMGEALL
jgi:hypothetical protein